MPDTVLDRYIGLADRAVHDSAARDELLAVFAPDATVSIGPEPVRGTAAITAFYQDHFASFVDSKHYWDTETLEDGTLEAHWVAASRMTDGSLITVAGIERAVVNADGLITELRNTFTRLPG
jgi:hypothetical protein